MATTSGTARVILNMSFTKDQYESINLWHNPCEDFQDTTVNTRILHVRVRLLLRIIFFLLQRIENSEQYKILNKDTDSKIFPQSNYISLKNFKKFYTYLWE